MSLSNNYPTIQPTLNLSFALTKQLDPRITFTRTSTATYYDGVTTAMAEQNLLTYSQEFDNAAWVKTGATITANSTTAPDGTVTGDALFETSATSQHFIAQTISNPAVTTVSVYVKPNGRDWVVLEMLGATYAYFDVTNGVVGSTVNSPITSIVAVGNGWYRCTVTKTGVLSVTAINIYAASANGTASYAGDITKGVYIWGAQAETRSSVTAYTATTTQPITNYIPVLLTAAAGIPRFNHNPTTGESLGLLIEESRTNLLTYSADWSNAAWTKGGATISADSNVAPDGTLTADRLVEDTSTGDHRAFQLTAFTSGTAYTFTVYAKASGRNLLMLANTMAGGFTSVFDLNAGTITSTTLGTAAITNVGNGWYRCSVSNTSGFTGNSNNQIRLVDTGTNTSYTGNGFSGVFLWGAQLEAGAFATSYVPTIAATVTRSADAASMTGTNFSSWFNAAEGTFCADFAGGNSISGLYGRAIGYDGAGSLIGGDNLVNRVSTWNGSVNLGVAFTGSVLTGVKAVMAYSSAGRAIVANGQTVATDANLIGTVTTIRLGNSVSANESLNGTLRRVAYYPRRLTNTQLQALTTV